jgi:hypothetical protein
MRLVCCVVTAAMMLAAGGSARADILQTFDASGHEAASSSAPLLRSARKKPAIPEPSGVALLGMGLLGFAAVMRRRFLS